MFVSKKRMFAKPFTVEITNLILLQNHSNLWANSLRFFKNIYFFFFFLVPLEPYNITDVCRILLFCLALEGIPVKPGSRYHDEPVNIPMGSRHCVICGEKTHWMCWDPFPWCVPLHNATALSRCTRITTKFTYFTVYTNKGRKVCLKSVFW